MFQDFLNYSIRHNRKIKVLMLIDSKLSTKNIFVIRADDQSFSYLEGKKEVQTCPLSALLSCQYARGDDGDSLKNQARDDMLAQEDLHK